MKLTLERIKEELVQPSTSIGKILLRLIHTIFSYRKKKKSCLIEEAYLIWDIRCNSISFDFTYTILDAFLLLQRKGYKELNLIIFTPKDFKKQPFTYKEYDKFISAEDIAQRLPNMIIPIAKSFDCIKTIRIIREEKEIYSIIRNYSYILPQYYNPKYFRISSYDQKRIIRAFKKNIKDLKMPNLLCFENISTELSQLYSRLGESKYVTLTLRDYGYNNNRSTSQKDLDNSILFAESQGAKLVIIPDVLENLSNYLIPDNVLVSVSSRKLINDRVSMYSNSLINLFSPSGTYSLSLCIKNAKSIMFNFAKGGFDSSEDYYMKYYNLSLGEQPYLKIKGYLLWNSIFPDYTVNDLLYAYKILT